MGLADYASPKFISNIFPAWSPPTQLTIATIKQNVHLPPPAIRWIALDDTIPPNPSVAKNDDSIWPHTCPKCGKQAYIGLDIQHRESKYDSICK
jgi:hypothetical protein